MASVLSNALVVLFIFSSRFAIIFGWCDDDRFSRSCSSDQICCGNQCVNGSSCLHQSCSTDFDCSVNEACCSGQCQHGSNCLGNYCSNNSDCSVYESCCNNVCQYRYGCTCIFHGSYNDAFLIPFIVVGSLVAFFIVMMFIYYCNRRARLGRPCRVEVERQVTTTVPTTTQSVTNAPPQAHQQGHAYQSLPQCDQYQNAAPPPYSGRIATGSDLKRSKNNFHTLKKKLFRV